MPPRFDHAVAPGLGWRREMGRLLRPALVLAGLALLVAGAVRWFQAGGSSAVLLPDAATLGLWTAGVGLLCIAALLHRQA